MSEIFLRRDGAWVPLLGGSEPPPDPDPDPVPATIEHGSDLSPYSAQVASQIGPSGALTEWTGSTTLSGTQTIENYSFTNTIVTIAAGADITFSNCKFVGPLGQTTYTIRATNGGGLKVAFEDCEIVTRTTTASSPRCIAMWGDGNVKAVRTIFRGGIDNLYMNPSNSPGEWATGDSLTPNARVHLVECWLGDLQRVPGSHTDNVQFDGGGYAVIERCRHMSYSLPSGSDPLTTRITNKSTAELGGGGIIATQNSSNPNQLSNIALRDCWHEGGNYTVDLSPSDGLTPHSMECTGGRFGVRSRFGPLRLPSGSVSEDNRWGESGTTEWTAPITVTEGELLPGSSA